MRKAELLTSVLPGYPNKQDGQNTAQISSY